MNQYFSQHVPNVTKEKSFIEFVEVHGKWVVLVWQNYIEFCRYEGAKNLSRRVAICSGDPTSRKSNNTSTYSCGKFSPDGTLFAAGTNSGTVELFHCDKGEWLEQPMHTFVAPEYTDQGIRCLDFHPHGEFLAVGYSDSTNKFLTWSLNDYSVVLGGPGSSRSLDVDHGVEILKYHPNGKEMMVKDFNSLTIRDSTTMKKLHTLTNIEDFCFDAVYSPSGNEIAICLENVVKFWNVSSAGFTDIVIPCRCLNLMYVAEHTVAYSESTGKLNFRYTDTGILFLGKTVHKSLNVMSFCMLNKHTVLYALVRSNQPQLLNLPYYNYSKMTKKRLSTGIVEDMIAAASHPMVTNADLETSPVQDKEYFKNVLRAVRSNNARHKIIETKRRQNKGIADEIAAASRHPMVTQAADSKTSPVQDKEYFKNVFRAIRSNNTRGQRARVGQPGIPESQRRSPSPKTRKKR